MSPPKGPPPGPSVIPKLTANDPSRCSDHARTQYLVHLVTPAQGTVCQPDEDPYFQTPPS